jgi:hypothetical protein
MPLISAGRCYFSFMALGPCQPESCGKQILSRFASTKEPGVPKRQ